MKLDIDELKNEMSHLIKVLYKFKDYLDNIIANDSKSKYLTINQVCKRFGISRSTLLKYSHRYPPHLPKTSPRSKLYWDVKDIVKYENKKDMQSVRFDK